MIYETVSAIAQVGSSSKYWRYGNYIPILYDRRQCSIAGRHDAQQGLNVLVIRYDQLDSLVSDDCGACRSSFLFP
jgi:hypothetical protein